MMLNLKKNHKIMKLTRTWLRKHNACKEAVIEFKKSNITDLFEILSVLIKSNNKEKLEWANWLIVRTMNKTQQVQYSIFAAELVIDIFEKEYSKDIIPRKAIAAAKKYLKRQSIKNKNAADVAAVAAAATYAVATYAAAAADAAAYAAYATDYNKTLIKILKNGIKLVKRDKYKSLR